MQSSLRKTHIASNVPCLLMVLLAVLIFPSLAHAINLGDIVTIAGGGVGDNSAATSANVNKPTGVVADSSGNLYIADYFNNRIRKVVSETGIITTVAGNGVYGFSGDNGAATQAAFSYSYSVTVDSSGNLYIADQYSHRIRKVASGTGIITTVAGNGTAGFSGDNGAATSASLNYPCGVTVDNSGNLYIADGSNNRIRKVDIGTGIITTVAGNGAGTYSGDNGAATTASLRLPTSLAFDSGGNLYITDSLNQRIRKVDRETGIITTVAGNGTKGFSGDDSTATSASLSNPYGVTFDSSGNLYFGDMSNNRIRKVDSGTSIITTVAGNGTAGYSGDNGAAIYASLNAPRDVTVDSSGNLFIADYLNYRIRKVDCGTGIITTVAGNGTEAYAGDNGPATSASFSESYGVTVDSSGNVYVADYSNNRIRKVASGTGIITTVAGNGSKSFNGDNIAATSASLYAPFRVTFDNSGNLYIADSTNHRIRKVASGTGIITTVAGNGSSGYSGDNVIATSASLYWPSSVTFDNSGNLYIADYGNHRIRKVAVGTKIITTVAGNGTATYAGDNGAAISASLYRPSDVVVDSTGNLYISDYFNHRIRMVDGVTGIISTVAGNGTQGFGGDNGAATSASLNYPVGVTIDSSGNLYIADEWNARVRKVANGTGIITTFAGNGSPGYSGDNGPATSASLYEPSGVAFDNIGNLYIVDYATRAVRKVYLNRVPTVTALISSAVGNSSVSGSAITFTATVTSTEGIPINSVVTFMDGDSTIGSSLLDAAGVATFTTSSLTLGSHNITASFPVTGILAGSTSPVLASTVTVPPGNSILSVSLLGTGGGSVTSSPTGIVCIGASSSRCVQDFHDGTPITLSATPDWKSTFTGWGTPCDTCGIGNCQITLNANSTVSATFAPIPRVRIPGKQDVTSLQGAFNNAVDQNQLRALVYVFPENVTTNNPANLFFYGGMADDFVTPSGYTTLLGSLTISKGSLTISNLIIE